MTRLSNLPRSLSRAVLSMVFLLALSMIAQSSASAPRLSGVINLHAPPFVSVAHAQASPESVLAGIADEAGIAAYFDKGQAITLSSVRGLFRTIEVETATYILGSMQATGPGLTAYAETEDPHVYVNTNGWVMAYYLSADPVSKIVDVYNYAGGVINTKLELVLNRVAPGYTPTFYHFQYPSATKLLLVADHGTSSADDSFQINLPGTFPTYNERSWALGDEGCCGITRLLLNNVQIGTADDGGNYGNTYGVLSEAQLGTNQTHTVLVDVMSQSTGALAIVYRDVP